MKLPFAHLAYCTNIHPAESWDATWQVLQTHTLKVRDRVLAARGDSEPFAIGLRLSARAAEELLTPSKSHSPPALEQFRQWLKQENCYIFTINGFPYGNFHDTRVKEKVYQPDWSSDARLSYTKNLFTILAALLPDGVDGSVSTVPGSFKEFEADEEHIFSHLYECAHFIETLCEHQHLDLHLGLEPEPLGHFENTSETIAFFERFHQWAQGQSLDTECVRRRIGLNYDTCHFALEFEEFESSIKQFNQAGIRISKIHLSNALRFNPSSEQAHRTIASFNEPTYLHQVILQQPGETLVRFKDLPDFFAAGPSANYPTNSEARVHFHIPLYATPSTPLNSTQSHTSEALDYCRTHPSCCNHLEIETYTWGVLPASLQVPIDQQISNEYAWVLQSLAPS